MTPRPENGTSSRRTRTRLAIAGGAIAALPAAGLMAASSAVAGPELPKPPMKVAAAGPQLPKPPMKVAAAGPEAPKPPAKIAAAKRGGASG